MAYAFAMYRHLRASFPHLFFALIALGAVACGSDASPSTGSSAPEAPPSTSPGVPAAAAPVTALPAPVPPAAWSTTMDELIVDGTTVRDVSATCGMFAMMPVVQIITAATAGCADRAGVTLAAAFEGGHLTALEVTGPGAACVQQAALQATTSLACQFQLTFGS